MSSHRPNDSEGLAEVPHFVTSRLRAKRQQTGLSVRALARLVDVSPSFISQIENGKANPSVGTLLAIVSALGLSLDDLFAETEDAEPVPASDVGELGSAAPPQPPASRAWHGGWVLRATDRPIVDLAGGVRWERLTPDVDPDVTFLYVRYDVGGSSSPPGALMQHNGREYGLVLSGSLGAQVGEQTYVLDPGDSIVTDCTIPHRFWTIGDEPAIVIWTIIRTDAA
ncbi:helix-turn-helix domain-containing protein [Capillimicrobium parvum]|uniref:HTH cro/C1-type domain-containing protein n=1 Tax=Capillimicrobium parvum TaxID=2884022 RepID=A0A9E6Y315_9ACTN|nr:helix-turn-helix domain-containing protein [Capillimicrobium parvum]UGS38973.1 hypothetical protein DSM104329_05405 [Capillimicrobium parvum]